MKIITDKKGLWFYLNIMIIFALFTLGIFIGAKIQGSADLKQIDQLKTQIHDLTVVQKTDVKAIVLENLRDDIRDLEMKFAILGARDLSGPGED